MRGQPLTESERTDFARYADEFGAEWRNHAVGLVKWLFGTLITINTGGMFFAANANVHPEALRDVYWLLFAGLAAALLAAYVEVFRSSRLNDIAFKIKYGSEALDEHDSSAVRGTFRFWSMRSIPVLLCFISITCFFFGGAELSGATIPCSVSDLEYSKNEGENIIPMGRGSKTCYFYQVDGLSNDPLERALQEQELIKIMNAIDDQRSTPIDK